MADRREIVLLIVDAESMSLRFVALVKELGEYLVSGRDTNGTFLCLYTGGLLDLGSREVYPWSGAEVDDVGRLRLIASGPGGPIEVTLPNTQSALNDQVLRLLVQRVVRRFEDVRSTSAMLEDLGLGLRLRPPVPVATPAAVADPPAGPHAVVAPVWGTVAALVVVVSVLAAWAPAANARYLIYVLIALAFPVMFTLAVRTGWYTVRHRWARYGLVTLMGVVFALIPATVVGISVRQHSTLYARDYGARTTATLPEHCWQQHSDHWIDCSGAQWPAVNGSTLTGRIEGEKTYLLTSPTGPYLVDEAPVYALRDRAVEVHSARGTLWAEARLPGWLLWALIPLFLVLGAWHLLTRD